MDTQSICSSAWLSFQSLSYYFKKHFLLEEAQKKADKKFPNSFVEPIFDIVLDLAQEEGFFGLNHIDIDNFSLSDQIHLQNVLRKYNLRYQNLDEFLQLLDNPKQNINDFIEQFFTPDIDGLELYDNLREQFNRNAFELS